MYNLEWILLKAADHSAVFLFRPPPFQGGVRGGSAFFGGLKRLILEFGHLWKFKSKDQTSQTSNGEENPS
jgi:hypothetical protein